MWLFRNHWQTHSPDDDASCRIRSGPHLGFLLRSFSRPLAVDLLSRRVHHPRKLEILIIIAWLLCEASVRMRMVGSIRGPASTSHRLSSRSTVRRPRTFADDTCEHQDLAHLPPRAKKNFELELELEPKHRAKNPSYGPTDYVSTP